MKDKRNRDRDSRSPLHSTRPSVTNAVHPIDQSLPLRKVTPLPQLTAEETAQPIDSLDQLTPTPSLIASHKLESPQAPTQLWDTLRQHRSNELNTLRHAVRDGSMTTDKAERQLMRYALIDSLALPPQLAEDLLPSLVEIVELDQQLRKELSMLWQDHVDQDDETKS